MNFYPFLLFFLFNILALQLKGQTNLVVNGSFEDYYNCPALEGELNQCVGWSKPNIFTTDYVNNCSGFGSGLTPSDYFMGYQIPFHGNGIIGIGVYYPSFNVASEGATTQLLSPLLPNHKYLLRFYISLANRSKYTIDNFGAYLSVGDIFDFSNGPTYTYQPQIIAPRITDTTNWTLVYGEFTAQGGENWLTFCRYDYNGLPNALPFAGETSPFPWDSLPYCYILLDSVSLIDITTKENIPEFPNGFSPNGDGENDFYLLPRFDFFVQQKMEIYNRWGTKIIELNDITQLKWDGKNQNGNELPEGTYFYFYSARDSNQNIFNRKGNISLFR